LYAAVGNLEEREADKWATGARNRPYGPLAPIGPVSRARCPFIGKGIQRVKRVLIIEHMRDDPMGYVGNLLEEHGIPYDCINVEKEPVPDPADYAAVVALGGSQHVYNEDKHPYFTQEKAMLRRMIEREIPFLGICLGSQLLADVLGGQVRQHTMTEIGFFDVPLTEEGHKDPLYAGLPGYHKVFHWHEDTFDLPAGAVLLETNENTENQAFRYGRHAYGLQYHIEITPEILDTWLCHPDNKPDAIEALGGMEAYTALERERVQLQPIYYEHTRVLFENFLRISGLLV